MKTAPGVLLLALALSVSSEGIGLQKRFENLTEEQAVKLWIEEIASYIITKSERTVFESLTTSEERVRFIETFWKRRDPTPETPENEYQIEHYRRLAYVNRFFGAGRPGWRTDRGRLYILLGPPDVIDSDPMGRQMHQYPTEVWIYHRPAHPRLPPNMEIAFVDTRLTGEYELTFNLLKDADATRQMEALIGENFHDAMTLQEMRASNFGRSGTMHFGDGLLPELERLDELALVSQIPERQLRPLSEEVRTRFSFRAGPLEAARQIEFYRASEGQICTPVTLRVPYQDFTFLEKPDHYESRLDVFGRILGPDGEVIDEFNREEIVRVPRDQLDRMKTEFLLYQLIFYAPPGQYQLELAVRDNASNTVRTAVETLRVPDLEQSLSLSSVVLADAIVKLDPPPKAGEKEPFTFGELEAVPNFTRTFTARGTLNVYFEAYNLALDDEGKNSLKLSYRFEREGARYREVPATYLYPTDQRQRSIMSAIPLKDFTPGDYLLHITLTDGVAERSVAAEIDFHVSESQPPSSNNLRQ
jgi:GWxTD domain-containing protein